jgi:membrane-bound metal-dependent hydrolase YbcI (DUF457 family)
MDLFTHVLFAYLVSFVVWGPSAPQYIAAGALAGGLPDADILLIPVAHYFQLLRHRGIVHSLVGITVIAAFGSLLVHSLPYFGTASIFLYFIAMEIGGLLHIFLDGATQYSITPFAPFSTRKIEFNIDTAVNVIALIISMTSMIILLAEHGAVSSTIWIETVWILWGVYAGYFLLRILTWRNANKIKKEKNYLKAIPTINPFVWELVNCIDSKKEYNIEYQKLSLFKKITAKKHTLHIIKKRIYSGPVNSTKEALNRTYSAALKKNKFLALQFHFGEAFANRDVYKVFWYTIGDRLFNLTLGVSGEINRHTGKMQLKTTFIHLHKYVRE